jgi:hypothetical protein
MTINDVRAAADFAIQELGTLRGASFGYDEGSVRWLDDYIEEIRGLGAFSDPKQKDQLAGVFGAYLGECVVRCYGGAWREVDGTWIVDFGGKGSVFPLARAYKQIENGKEDSIGSFFRGIPVVFAGKIGQPNPPT